jgi:hypothetical protein
MFQDEIQWWALVKVVNNLQVYYEKEMFNQMYSYQLLSIIDLIN